MRAILSVTEVTELGVLPPASHMANYELCLSL